MKSMAYATSPCVSNTHPREHLVNATSIAMKFQQNPSSTSASSANAVHRLTHRYSNLRTHIRARLKDAQASAGAIQNHMTTLNAWLSILKLSDDSSIGEELGTGFDKSLTFFMDEMSIAKLSKRTIQDRSELMLRFRQQATSMFDIDTLPADFSAALTEAMRRRELTTGEVARASGISLITLRTWETGAHTPQGESLTAIAGLEDALGVPRGMLLSRLGMRAMTWHSSRSKRRELPVAQTKFGKRMSKLVASKLRYIAWPHGQLKNQWKSVVAYKTNAFRDGAVPGNTWRLKPTEQTGGQISNASVLDDQVCASADAAWGYIGSYLGWLSLPEPEGGGIPSERVNTLAWLLRDDKILAYLAWRQRRAGVVHRGLTQVLNYACMLLRPESGWLWINDSLIHTLEPADNPIQARPDADLAERQRLWRTECARVWAVFRDRAKKLSAKGVMGRSRDSTESIAAILAESRPLRPVMEMIATLERSPPPPSAAANRATWLRDIVLLKMLVSNPLRAHHFSIMTYRRDNTGNLYRTSTGEWRLRYKAADFKNEKHAAHADYDAGVPGFLWKDIERYLEEGRPYLLEAAHCDYVMLRSRCGPNNPDAPGTPCRRGMWFSGGIEVRIKELTLLLRPGYPAFRTHAFRHIVATDYLKRHPGAFLNVAHLLHDKLATVMADYGHLSVDDGLRGHFASVEEEWASIPG